MKRAIIVKAIGCKKCEALIDSIGGEVLEYSVSIEEEGTDTGDAIINEYSIKHFPTTIFFTEKGKLEGLSESILESSKKLKGIL